MRSFTLCLLLLCSTCALVSCDDNEARIQEINSRLSEIDSEISEQRVIYYGAPFVGGAITGATGGADGGAGLIGGVSAGVEAGEKIDSLQAEAEQLRQERDRLSR